MKRTLILVAAAVCLLVGCKEFEHTEENGWQKVEGDSRPIKMVKIATFPNGCELFTYTTDGSSSGQVTFCSPEVAGYSVTNYRQGKSSSSVAVIPVDPVAKQREELQRKVAAAKTAYEAAQAAAEAAK